MGYRTGRTASPATLSGCFSIFICITAAVSLVRRLEVPGAYLLVPLLWTLGALLPGWKDRLPPPVLGLAGTRLWNGLRLFVLSSILIFPLYGLLFYLLVRLGLAVPDETVRHGSDIYRWLFYNFALVAFTEELFFRGYLQGVLEEHARVRYAGPAPVFWAPVLVSALLFALAHVAVYLDPLRISVFFPGLLFGWLRAKTGSVLAPVLSHGTANLVSMLLTGWLS